MTIYSTHELIHHFKPWCLGQLWQAAPDGYGRFDFQTIYKLRFCFLPVDDYQLARHFAVLLQLQNLRCLLKGGANTWKKRNLKKKHNNISQQFFPKKYTCMMDNSLHLVGWFSTAPGFPGMYLYYDSETPNTTETPNNV